MLVQVVRRARAHTAAPGARPRTRSGSGTVVHDALERLYAEPPGEDVIPGPGDVGRWRDRFGELSTSSASRFGGAQHSRAAPLWSAPRPRSSAFLDAEAESESEFRPARELLELGFGRASTRARGRGAQGRARARRRQLRGRIDRIDVDADVAAPSCATTRPASRSHRRQVRQATASCRSSSTCASRERILGLDPVGGLYHPLGAAGRRAPSRAASSPARTRTSRGSGLVGTDRLEHDDSSRCSTRPRRSRATPPTEMQAGEIRRHPIGGECPKYCNFQAICRLERAIGVDENGNGVMTPARGTADPRRTARPRSRSRRRPTPARRAGVRARPPSSAPRSPRASATPSSRPAPAPARRPCSSTATAPPWPTTASPSTASWPSRSPNVPQRRCARGCAAS